MATQLTLFDWESPAPSDNGAQVRIKSLENFTALAFEPLFNPEIMAKPGFDRVVGGASNGAAGGGAGDAQTRLTENGGQRRVYHTKAISGDDAGWTVIAFSMDSGTTWTRYARYRYYASAIEYTASSIEWQQEYNP